MPRESCQIILRDVIAKVIQEEERVKVGCVTEAEGSAQMHAGALERRFGLNEAFYGT
jgi:hypothetical protein